MNPEPYMVRSFEDFWPHYVALHTRRETQVAHAVATLSCLTLLVAAGVLRQPILAVTGPIVDYAIAQASHRMFEQNRTTPWKNLLWHTRAELRMLRLVLAGRGVRRLMPPDGYSATSDTSSTRIHDEGGGDQ
jgi:hypothetical protein